MLVFVPIAWGVHYAHVSHAVMFACAYLRFLFNANLTPVYT